MNTIIDEDRDTLSGRIKSTIPARQNSWDRSRERATETLLTAKDSRVSATREQIEARRSYLMLANGRMIPSGYVSRDEVEDGVVELSPELERDIAAIQEASHYTFARAVGIRVGSIGFTEQGGICRPQEGQTAEPAVVAAFLLAGIVGERIAYGCDRMGASDLASARAALAETHSEDEIDGITKRLEEYVEKLLREKWSEVETIAAALKQDGRGLFGHEIEALLSTPLKLSSASDTVTRTITAGSASNPFERSLFDGVHYREGRVI